jgi:hypothetical protein
MQAKKSESVAIVPGAVLILEDRTLYTAPGFRPQRAVPVQLMCLSTARYIVVHQRPRQTESGG